MAKAKLAAKRQSMPDLRRNSGMIARATPGGSKLKGLKRILFLIRDFVELEGFERFKVGLVRMISEMLGHSTIQLTADSYTHLMAESKRELAEKMDVIT
ncbi:MAG TPA: hypothetical protein VK251_10400 [Steroidobacteraceae bacterium]|nr:hypothetical protein [Steroidobacteraceae bacterium]